MRAVGSTGSDLGLETVGDELAKGCEMDDGRRRKRRVQGVKEILSSQIGREESLGIEVRLVDQLKPLSDPAGSLKGICCNDISSRRQKR